MTFPRTAAHQEREVDGHDRGEPRYSKAIETREMKKGTVWILCETDGTGGPETEASALPPKKGGTESEMEVILKAYNALMWYCSHLEFVVCAREAQEAGLRGNRLAHRPIVCAPVPCPGDHDVHRMWRGARKPRRHEPKGGVLCNEQVVAAQSQAHAHRRCTTVPH